MKAERMGIIFARCATFAIKHSGPWRKRKRTFKTQYSFWQVGHHLLYCVNFEATKIAVFPPLLYYEQYLVVCDRRWHVAVF